MYAPLGVAMQIQREFPALVASGRETVGGPGAMYRAVGEFAVGQVRSKAEQHADGIYDLLSSLGLVKERNHDTQSEGGASGATDASADASAGDPPGPTPGAPDLGIDDYDLVPAAQIVPLLGELTARQREMVRAHETLGRGRRTILGRLDRLAEQDTEGANQSSDTS